LKLSLQFLGATQTVTGSKFLLQTDHHKVLVDCGMFQGLKELRLRNWEPFPVDPATIDAIVLTHAHIDHSGYLPRLKMEGFNGPVYCSSGTRDLCQLLLPDAGHLQEEDARLANAHGYSKHSPALPLFTEDDARASLKNLHTVPQHKPFSLNKELSFELLPMGHILGACCVRFTVGRGDDQRTLLFSGDVGRYDRPILKDPEPVGEADFLVVETTYGNRLHDDRDPKMLLAEAINEGLSHGGKIIIPSFAVGRTQELLYLLHELEEEGKMPPVPIYVDSPMAIDATARYITHPEDHDEAMRAALRKENPLHTSNFHLVRQFQQSQALSQSRTPAIVISASGMATGGRVLGHLAEALPEERNTVLFVGYQAEGTRGRQLVNGARQVKIRGQLIPVHARIVSIEALSAHADYEEMLRWLSQMSRAPRRTFLVHGEEESSLAFQKHLHDRLGWDSEIPVYAQRIDLLAGC
jgi:metallo-beta-lactamase family protein